MTSSSRQYRSPSTEPALSRVRIRSRSMGYFVWVVLCAAVIIAFSMPLASRENSTLIYREGIARAMAGDIDGAITLFRKSADLSPRYALAHYGLGRAYLHKSGKRTDAIRELTYAVQCDSKLSKGYFYLGLAFMFDAKYMRAIHAFHDAYGTDRNCIEALYNIGAVYDVMGQTQKANQYYSRYFALLSGEFGEF
jgi:tetratricopeptide (TPR) repeat protein